MLATILFAASLEKTAPKTIARHFHMIIVNVIEIGKLETDPHR